MRKMLLAPTKKIKVPNTKQAVADNDINTGTTFYSAAGKKNGNSNDVFFDQKNSNHTGNDNLIPLTPTVAEREKTWFERLTELKINNPVSSFNTSLMIEDGIESNRETANLLNAETKKEVAKAKRDKEIELLDKKDKKSLHLNLSNLFKPFSMHLDAEPWWAAGIAVNSNIPLNAQRRYNYNMNAKSGTLADYIPSPYLQFHLNNYVYLQTELNFVSPQLTPQLLLYRHTNDLAIQGGNSMSMQKSIYVQKMYYFSLPVSLHYSPVSNLYFSAGIQFSTFQSGLAATEEKQYETLLGPSHSTNTTNTLLKFKDDSIAAKIAPNEWRWQVGAEYYWNRFSVGLRYNQAFKNAINTTVSSTLPPTVQRNQSLLFFIRYNLFESRTKATVPKNQ